MPEQMIPVYTPRLDSGVAAEVADSVSQGWISSEGGLVAAFEEAWASLCGVGHGIAVNSGTSALEIAMAALELEPGSEVILPSYTIISCASAILNAGLSIRLVDVDPDTWCIDTAQMAAAINAKTKAVMPVHMFGHPADMTEISALAAAHGLKIVEDAAEAHGATIGGRTVGGIGDIGCFSFYANKIVTTGEGGMAVTDDPDLAERLRSYRNLCFSPERRFKHYRIGHAYRMTSMQAVIGLSQINHLSETIEAKRKLAGRYRAALKDIPALKLPVERGPVRNVYWMFGVVLGPEVPFEADEFARRLRAKGIDTRPFFLGMHEQPVFRDRGLFEGESHPASENLARRGLYLPSGTDLTGQQIERICDAVEESLRGP